MNAVIAVFVDVAGANAVAPAHVIERARLRVDRRHGVALDEHPADVAIHGARLEVGALLVESRDRRSAARGNSFVTLV